MATERTASVTWQGSLLDGSGTIDSRRQRRLRPARRHLGLPRRGAGRPDEPGGADRRGVGVVLLDGALARARAGGLAAERLDTSVTVTFQPGEGIVKGAHPRARHRPRSRRGGVPRSRRTARRANCPVSKALAGIPEVTLDAALGVTARATAE